jgi:hypothetical protein
MSRSGRWVGLTKKRSHWLSVVLCLSTLAVLGLWGNLDLFFVVFFSVFVLFPWKEPS